MRDLYYRLQYYFVRVSVFVISRLSYSFSNRIAEMIGSLLFLRKRRRQIALDNIQAAFPKLTHKEVLEIGRRSMVGMIKVATEFIQICPPGEGLDKSVEIKGRDYVKEALQLNRGVLFVVSHFGNWELMGLSMAANGVPAHAVGKPMKNPYIYKLLQKMRVSTGMETIDQTGAVKKIRHLLKENKIVAMLVDERIKEGGVSVDFFGRKAETSDMIARLSLKWDVPVISTFYYRGESGRSCLSFEKAYQTIRTGDLEKDIVANTQMYMNRLEEEIRKKPESWILWSHNRWG